MERSLCIIQVPRLKINNSPCVRDVRMKLTVRTFALSLPQSLYRLTKMSHPGLGDRKKYLLSHLQFSAGIVGQGLKQKRHGVAAFALVDKDLS